MIAGSRELVAQASAARPPLILKDPLALAAIAALPGAFDRAQANAAWSALGLSGVDAGGLWSALDAAGLLADDDDPAWWETREWREARTYHEATRDYPFLQMDAPGAFVADAARMRSYADSESRPSPYQRVGGSNTVVLERVPDARDADEVLAQLSGAARRSIAGLGLLLDVCFGERGRITVADGSANLLKSIPSGGARHPTEIFVAAFELEGVPAGVYHYDVDGHRLVEVRGGQQREAFAAATLDLFARYDTSPAAALVFTSLVERAMWRYRDPRSFRAILVDIGHAVAAYRYAAGLLGWRTYAYQKMRDSVVAELVDVDRIGQPPLYVGTLVP